MLFFSSFMLKLPIVLYLKHSWVECKTLGSLFLDFSLV